MEMNRRIRERRLALNLTQEDLAHRLGMQKSAIAKYESGRVENIKRSVVAKMAEILECSPAYLMGWDDGDTQIPSFSNILPIQTKQIPLLGEIACGQPIFCTEDRESYVETGTDVKADFCLKARGDSMTGARILDGDVVFIQKDAPLEAGQIYAVAIDDEATLKRVYYDEAAQVLQLLSENAKYPPMIYSGERLDHVHILGKAIAFQSDVI
jgi:SOS-response transcriptional repressors (recA-mediated autopeptidases)|uniref:Repressor protein CI n=1 Tax=Siphoviridae sp. ctmP938 TaxID=2827933 RepID=A0A8S5S453_9CAUD|nr:MAG TPA: Repressor protein CI [Siphoviridae sp. ctmP938]